LDYKAREETIAKRKTYYRSGIIENKKAINECLQIERKKDLCSFSGS
jgi:hypothetical protein